MIMITIFGIFLILIFSWLQYKKSKCNKSVEATYIKADTHYTFGIWSNYYIPIFKYFYNGIQYESRVIEPINKRKLESLMKNIKCNILIDEKNPKNIIIDKKIRFDEISILLIGVLFIFVGVLLMHKRLYAMIKI